MQQHSTDVWPLLPVNTGTKMNQCKTRCMRQVYESERVWKIVKKNWIMNVCIVSRLQETIKCYILCCSKLWIDWGVYSWILSICVHNSVVDWRYSSVSVRHATAAAPLLSWAGCQSFEWKYRTTGTINQAEWRPWHYKGTLSSYSFITPARHNIHDELLLSPVNGVSFTDAHSWNNNGHFKY